MNHTQEEDDGALEILLQMANNNQATLETLKELRASMIHQHDILVAMMDDGDITFKDFLDGVSKLLDDFKDAASQYVDQKVLDEIFG